MDILRPRGDVRTAPVEVVTDRAPVYPRVIDELVPAARHVSEQYATDECVNGGAARCCWSGLLPLRGVAACDRRLAVAVRLERPVGRNDVDRGEGRGRFGLRWAWST